jgi:hypothetical protein
MSTVVAEPGQNIEGANLGETMNKWKISNSIKNKRVKSKSGP